MAKKKRTKKTPRTTSSRKRTKTEKGSYYDEYFTESTGMTIDNPSLIDRSVFNGCEDNSQGRIVEGSSTSLVIKEVTSVSINDECQAKSTFQLEDGRKSDDGMGSLTQSTPDMGSLTQCTPDVLSDDQNVTPKLPHIVHCSESTPIVGIGRENKVNSVNLKQELERAEERIYNENRTVEHTNQHTDTLLLNNVYELHILHQQNNTNQCCENRAELEKKVEEQAKTIESLLYKRKEQELQAEKLGQELFQKEQKIMSDRVD